MRRIRVAAVTCLALVAMACGVRPIDPVQAGEGPNGQLRVAPVYFLDDRGALLPLQLSTAKTAFLSPESFRAGGAAVQSLLLLIAGPGAQSYGLDVHTEVPAADPKLVGATSVGAAAGEQRVTVPFEAGALSEKAKQQIACTVLVALLVQAGRSQPVAANVVIEGGSTVAPPVTCPVLP